MVIVKPFINLMQHRILIARLVKRDIIGKYQGSILGVFWSFFNPIFMLAVYTFFFSVVFKARWGTDVSSSKVEFALILFAGLLIYNFFAECANRSTSLIITNVNYVKKVVFPLEILTVVSVGAASFHLMVSSAVWLLFYMIFIGTPHWTIILFPLVLLPVFFFTLGFSWLFSALGVYLRDIGQIVAMAVMALSFLSPIFYPVSILPSNLQVILMLNPLTLVIEQTRDVLFFGRLINFNLYLVYLGISILFACLGYLWFQKTRKGFADVL